MRLLHVGHDYDFSGPAHQRRERDPRRRGSSLERQRLPLRHLSAHPGGRREGGQGDEGRWPMNDLLYAELPIEPERYELFESFPVPEGMDRRLFFRLVGGGIAVGLMLSEFPVFAQRGGGGNMRGDIGARLHVAEDGAITVYTGKVEIGQNARTSLTQVVAEELRVPVSRIKLVMADTQLVPDDGGTSG